MVKEMLSEHLCRFRKSHGREGTWQDLSEAGETGRGDTGCVGGAALFKDPCETAAQVNPTKNTVSNLARGLGFELRTPWARV